MLVIGCDLHTRYQQIGLLNTKTAAMTTRRLKHENREALDFCAGLPKGMAVGIEAVQPMV